MLSFVVTTILALILYLSLTTGSATPQSSIFGLWSLEEFIFGIILSVITGFIARKIFIKKSFRMLNPVRWIMFIVYLFPFLGSMAKANFDVAYRVITGKIKPGIVKIDPELKTDFGISLLANSITLTPGTLTVDIDEDDNNLYIHWINVDQDSLKKKPVDPKYVSGSFSNWVRRIAE